MLQLRQHIWYQFRMKNLFGSIRNILCEFFFYLQRKQAMIQAGKDLRDSANLLDEGDEDLLF